MRAARGAAPAAARAGPRRAHARPYAGVVRDASGACGDPRQDGIELQDARPLFLAAGWRRARARRACGAAQLGGAPWQGSPGHCVPWHWPVCVGRGVRGLAGRWVVFQRRAARALVAPPAPLHTGISAQLCGLARGPLTERPPPTRGALHTSPGTRAHGAGRF